MATETRTAWVHGNSAWLETTTGFLLERFGYFLRLKGDGENDVWVHYSVPTCLGGERWVVTDVSIQLRTWGEAAVTRVDVWDGSTRLGSAATELRSPHGAHRLEGADGDPLRIVRTALQSAQPVTAGIGVSLLVRSNKPRDAVAIGAVGVTFAPRT